MSKPHILEGESIEDFDALSESLRIEFQPANEAERSLVEMMVHHEWMMRRALRMQQHLEASAARGEEPDSKRVNLVVRYYKTHERGFSQTRRELENMRKHKRRMETMAVREANESKSRQRQWEQILKKMPTLTDWVN